jgi:hypothetical protein
MRSVNMLVAEQGTDWATWMEALRSEASDVVVVVQGENEARDHFVARASRRVSDLLDKGAILRSAGLVGGKDWHPQALRQRATLLRRMAAWMGRDAEGGRLFIDASNASGRHGIRALASAVSEETRGTPISIRIGHPCEPQIAAA